MHAAGALTPRVRLKEYSFLAGLASVFRASRSRTDTDQGAANKEHTEMDPLEGIWRLVDSRFLLFQNLIASCQRSILLLW